MDEVTRLVVRGEDQTAHLKAGRVIHVDGIPYELLDDVDAYSATRPIAAIGDDSEHGNRD